MFRRHQVLPQEMLVKEVPGHGDWGVPFRADRLCPCPGGHEPIQRRGGGGPESLLLQQEEQRRGYQVPDLGYTWQEHGHHL